MYRAMFGVTDAAGFVLAAQSLAGPALAEQRVYSNGKRDNGPCVEMRNDLRGEPYTTITLQRVRADCNRRYLTYRCRGKLRPTPNNGSDAEEIELADCKLR